MKQLSIIIGLIFLFGFLVSCEDYNTKVIEFEEIGFEPLLVLNAKLSDDSDSLLISLSKNNNYANAESSEFEKIDGAEIKLIVDNSDNYVAIPVEFNQLDDKFVYNYLVELGSNEIEGKTYKIEASHPSYPSISSEIRLPVKSEFIKGVYQENAYVENNPFGGGAVDIEYDGLSLTFQDNPDEENFYAFYVVSTTRSDTFIQEISSGVFDTIIYEGYDNQATVTSEDPSAVGLGNVGQVLYNDKGFNGQEVVFNIFFGKFQEIESYKVYYKNISESEYLFRQSYSRYIDSQDFGLFSEPTTLYNNIDNGLGLFTAEKTQDITF